MARSAPNPHLALALLLGINLFNYIDRQVLSAVLPKLKRDGTLFDPADEWRNTKLGLLTTAFMVSYMLLSPGFARLGDYMRRWWVIGIGVVLWSLASGSSGLATTYILLLLTRCFVGVGEAAYGPIAPAMISDLYPVKVRGKVMAFFYAAIPVGSALGFVIGGALSDLYGWRHAFWVTYVGLIPALLCFAMREPKRTQQASTGHEPSYFEVLRELRGIRSFGLCCAGMTCTTFVLGGVATWVPEYVFQREAKFALTPTALRKLGADRAVATGLGGLGGGVTVAEDGADPNYQTFQGELLVPATVTNKLRPVADGQLRSFAEMEQVFKDTLTKDGLKQYAEPLYEVTTTKESPTTGAIGLYFGVIVVIGGLIATLLGGWFGDWLRNRGVRGAYFHAAGWTTLLAWPFFVAMLYTPFPYFWGVLFVAVFLLFFNTGPANTILANVARSPIRATAFAINILIIHALGDAISPAIIGVVYDVASLHLAFLLVSALILVGGGLWVAGASSLDEDTRKAAD